MCSIMLFNTAFLLSYPDVVMKHMIISNRYGGGDGTGIAVLCQGSDILSQRGHDFTPQQAFKYAYKMADNEFLAPSWYCYHTRRATTARRVDSALNQPFHDPTTTLTLAHVGTVHTIDVWSKLGHAWSDGRMVFELATKYSSEPLRDLYRSDVGVCAGFYQGQPFYLGGYGNILTDGDATLLCTINPDKGLFPGTTRKVSGDVLLSSEEEIQEYINRKPQVSAWNDRYWQWVNSVDSEPTRPISTVYTKCVDCEHAEHNCTCQTYNGKPYDYVADRWIPEGDTQA